VFRCLAGLVLKRRELYLSDDVGIKTVAKANAAAREEKGVKNRQFLGLGRIATRRISMRKLQAYANNGIS
jgi:hypothetical protein